jgi:hypothetical protein
MRGRLGSDTICSHAARDQAGSPPADEGRNVAEQLGNTLRFYKYHGVRKSRCLSLIAPSGNQSGGRLIFLETCVSENLQSRLRALHGQIGQHQRVLFFVHQSHGLGGCRCGIDSVSASLKNGLEGQTRSRILVGQKDARHPRHLTKSNTCGKGRANCHVFHNYSPVWPMSFLQGFLLPIFYPNNGRVDPII